jgi:hypothetical protein
MTEDDTFNKLKKWSFDEYLSYGMDHFGKVTNGEMEELSGWTKEEFIAELKIQHKLRKVDR